MKSAAKATLQSIQYLPLVVKGGPLHSEKFQSQSPAQKFTIKFYHHEIIKLIGKSGYSVPACGKNSQN